MNFLLEKDYVKNAIEQFELPLFYIYLINEILKFAEVNDEKLLIILLAVSSYLHYGSICVRKNQNLYNLLSKLGIIEPTKIVEDFFSR